MRITFSKCENIGNFVYSTLAERSSIVAIPVSFKKILVAGIVMHRSVLLLHSLTEHWCLLVASSRIGSV